MERRRRNLLLVDSKSSQYMLWRTYFSLYWNFLSPLGQSLMTVQLLVPELVLKVTISGIEFSHLKRRCGRDDRPCRIVNWRCWAEPQLQNDPPLAERGWNEIRCVTVESWYERVTSLDSENLARLLIFESSAAFTLRYLDNLLQCFEFPKQGCVNY